MKHTQKFETTTSMNTALENNSIDILAMAENDGDTVVKLKKATANKVTYDLSSGLINFGSDFMVYDRKLGKFGVLDGSTFNASTFNANRYETNFDIPISRQGGYLHAVSMDEAVDPLKYRGIQRYNYIDNNYCAAEYCYYRIEVDNSKAGGFHFKVTPDTTSYEGDVSWNANDSVLSIVEQMETVSWVKYTVTTNNPSIPGNGIRSISGEAIGVAVGGAGNNTCVISSVINDSAIVVDMSKYAAISSTLTVNDPYDGTLPVIDGSFKNWRGASCISILGRTLIPLSPLTRCLGNSGYDYGYRNGINFAGWKAYATTKGVVNYCTDGVGGTANNSTSKIMKKTVFDEMMDSENGAYNDAMHTYYDNLLNSDEEPYKTTRDTYTEWYGQPQELYDVYLMTHMLKLDAASGIVETTRNKGKELTSVKGKVFAVTYNYTYVPAYPPEYNALHYGKAAMVGGSDRFVQGFYYHPEPGDLGLFLRDDMMAKCNTAWAMVPQSLHPYRTSLSNNNGLGSIAEFNPSYLWYFAGSMRTLEIYVKSASTYKSRPCSVYSVVQG